MEQSDQQLSFDAQLNRRWPDISQHIEDQFLSFHKQNPHIYELFKRISYEARHRWDHFGCGAIFERMRWETDVKSSDKTFKLNNNLRSAYVRFLIEEDPTFKAFFETRRTPGSGEIH